MAYDAELAERIRLIVRNEAGVAEKRMFGGLAFLIDGRLAAAASGEGGMLLRVEPSRTQSVVAYPHVERFKMRGRELNGWLWVGPQAIATKRGLRKWLALGMTYPRSLPPK